MGRIFKLAMWERVGILNILPSEHNYATLRIVRDLQMKMAPSEAEIEEMGIREEDGEPDARGRPGPKRMVWNDKGREERNLEVSDGAVRVITEALNKLNERNAITPATMSIYEKFVVAKEE